MNEAQAVNLRVLIKDMLTTAQHQGIEPAEVLHHISDDICDASTLPPLTRYNLKLGLRLGGTRVAYNYMQS